MRTSIATIVTGIGTALLISGAPLRAQQITATTPATRDTIMLSAVVVDEEGRPLPGVDVVLGSLNRRARTDSKGQFRIMGLAPGEYEVNVRRIGYAARNQLLRTSVFGGVVPEILLVPTSPTLAPIVAAADRGGLFGIVADTGMRPVAGARVSVAGSGLNATTDSLGAFYVPLRPGSYLVYIDRKPFSRQLIGVTVPKSVGREIAVWLHQIPRKNAIVEAMQLFDLNQRIVGSSKASTRFFTRDALLEQGITSIDGLARRWAGAGITSMCTARLGGQNNWSQPINQLQTDDIEFVEMYMSNAVGMQAPRGVTSIGGNRTTIMTETGRGQPIVTRDCGNLSFIVWPRS